MGVPELESRTAGGAFLIRKLLAPCLLRRRCADTLNMLMLVSRVMVRLSWISDSSFPYAAPYQAQSPPPLSPYSPAPAHPHLSHHRAINQRQIPGTLRQPAPIPEHPHQPRRRERYEMERANQKSGSTMPPLWGLTPKHAGRLFISVAIPKILYDSMRWTSGASQSR